jgi:hypothetical protein
MAKPAHILSTRFCLDTAKFNKMLLEDVFSDGPWAAIDRVFTRSKIVSRNSFMEDRFVIELAHRLATSGKYAVRYNVNENEVVFISDDVKTFTVCVPVMYARNGSDCVSLVVGSQSTPGNSSSIVTYEVKSDHLEEEIDAMFGFAKSIEKMLENHGQPA